MPNDHIYFYDTSAIIKILLEEPGSVLAGKILGDEAPLFTSWVLLGEALGVLKRKLLDGQLNRTDYCESVDLLFSLLRMRKIRPTDIELVNEDARLVLYGTELSVLMDKYQQLDAADALQFAAIRENYIRAPAPLKLAILVTADEKLAKAAREEGIETLLVNKDA